MEQTTMLIGIDPILGPDLLHVMRSMGHGDVLALVDRNFPATSHAPSIVRLDGVDTVRAATAILSVLPVDDFVTPAVFRMQVVGDPAAITPVQRDFQEVLDRACGRPVAIEGIERFEFYSRTRDAYAAVITGEDRPYGCFLITKGVVAADRP
jgi:L-fucose mutarotase